MRLRVGHYIAIAVLLIGIVYLICDYSVTDHEMMEMEDDLIPTSSKANFRDAYATTIINPDGTVTVTFDKDAYQASQNSEPVSVDTSSWYSDVSAMSAGGVVSDVGGTFNVYNGLPWESKGEVYYYNFTKAKNDIYDIFLKAGVTQAGGSSVVVNSSKTSTSYTKNLPVLNGSVYAEIDGIKCIPICVSPAMVSRNYYANNSKSRSTAEGDSVSLNGVLKLAIVVVEKGNDANDSKNWLYIPATRGDAKAHTWFGGVVQTNVKVINETTLQISKDWSGTSANSQHNVTVSQDYNVEDTIRLVESEIERVRTKTFTMGTWSNNCLETYGISENTRNEIASRYSIIGFMVWGGV